MQNSVLIGMLTTLLAKDKVSAEEFAEKYEISTRTVIRYIDALSESGVPIVTYRGRNGGYGIMKNYKMPATFFTNDEYERLFTVLDAMPKDKITESISDKFRGLKNSQPANLSGGDKILIDSGFSPSFQNKYNILNQSIDRHAVVNINYIDKFGGVSQRDIEPLTFVYKDNVWYIFAYCRKRNDFRFFKLNRISSLSPTEETFTPRAYSLNADNLDKFVEKHNHVDVELSFDNDILVDVQEWLGEEKIIKKGAGFRAYANLPYDDYLLKKLASFGDKIMVVKPAKLATDLVKRMYRVIRRYESRH